MSARRYPRRYHVEAFADGSPKHFSINFMEPTFPYPSPDARHVFIKCDKDDPQREEFWCPDWCGDDQGDWRKKDEKPEHSACPSRPDTCGQTWRKRVEVPVGWRVAFLDERVAAPCKVLSNRGTWEEITELAFCHGELIAHLQPNTIIIRPIAKAVEGDDDGSKALARCLYGPLEDAPTNPYAVTIKGVTFDYYDFCQAAGMTNQPVAHAFKKLWRFGKSHKTAVQDLQEAKRSIERAIQIEEGM